MGRMMMTGVSTKTVLAVTVLAGFSTCAFAQGAAPVPWELKSDMGYAYGKDGKTLSYKMGTTFVGTLLKGAKKVPKGTLFFIGENGQLYMRFGFYGGAMRRFWACLNERYSRRESLIRLAAASRQRSLLPQGEKGRRQLKR